MAAIVYNEFCKSIEYSNQRANVCRIIPLGYLAHILFNQISYKTKPPSYQLDGGGGQALGEMDMLTKPKYTPKELAARYLAQLYKMLKVARRIGKPGLILALRKLIEKRGRE